VPDTKHMTTHHTTAATILAQIETGVRMSLGMRELTDMGDALAAKVGPGSKRLLLTITHNATDLYDLELTRLPRNAYAYVYVTSLHMIDAANLNTALLMIEKNGWGS
jgi:hypothetical protein